MMDEADQFGLAFGETADGRLVGVDGVPSGLACGLICPSCRKRLVAKKGNMVRHHFAHESDFACSGAVETMLHKLAKQIVSDAKGVHLPALTAYAGLVSKSISRAKWFPLDRVELEVWMDGVRPDIVGYRQDRQLAIEVLVTHACGPEKIAFIEGREIACIEIDLSSFRHHSSEEIIKHAVLQGAPRRWLFNAKLGPVQNALIAHETARRNAEREKREQDRLAAERKSFEAGRENRIKFVQSAVDSLGQEHGFGWNNYRNVDIPGMGRPLDIAIQGGPLFDTLTYGLKNIQFWLLNGFWPMARVELHPSEDELLGLPLIDLLRTRVKNDRERVKEALAARAREEAEILAAAKVRAEEAAAYRVDQEAKQKAIAEKSAASAKQKLDDFRSEIGKYAITMLGDVDGNAWLNRNPPWGWAPVNALTLITNPDDYWGWLREEIARRDRVAGEIVGKRSDLLSRAVVHFRSKEKATLWMNSKHPRLGMKRPNDACLESQGMERCIGILR